jgi:Predicted EndoIII-related endonuclease
VNEMIVPPLNEIAEILKRKYLDFDHNNKKNPLDELLLILCSIRTKYTKYEDIYRDLKKSFPTFGKLANADEGLLLYAFRNAGLGYQKAKAIKSTMTIVQDTFGKPTLASLRHWEDADVEKFLLSLPGVGRKTARCVMLFSLNRSVFPVDTHCWRICKRLGLINSHKRTPSDKEMDELQNLIPQDIRFSLHVNMVSLGRDSCKAINPSCLHCVLCYHCPKIQVINDDN